MRSHDLGRLFVLPIAVVAGTSWVHVAPTWEIEAPFRVCKRCLIVRIKPFKTALVLGWWSASGMTEDEALQRAVCARIVNLDDEMALDPNDACQRRTVRENIAAVDDLDAEWQLLDVLGLTQDGPAC